MSEDKPARQDDKYTNRKRKDPDTNPKSERSAKDSEEYPQNNPDSGRSRMNRPNRGSGSSFWMILFIVMGLIFLWNLLDKPDRYEIPIMQFVKLAEKGSQELQHLQELEKEAAKTEKTKGDSPDPSGQEENEGPADQSAMPNTEISAKPIPGIEVKEEKGKKISTVFYSNPAEICIGPNEVTGKIDRKVLCVEDKGKIKILRNSKTERVSFFAGRQGLNFDNNKLFDLLKQNGFEDVSAKGPPGFLETYGTTILTTVLLIVFVFFILNRMGAGAMAFGQNRGVLVAKEDVDVSFANVAGVDEAVEELKEIVDFLKVPEKFRNLGGRIPKGVLLVGPPGTGKTLLAKAVAGEAGVPFFSLSGSDFVELYAGVGAARVRDLFQQAERSAPCIVFIDELDALGKARSGNSFGAHDEREQTLNALLVEMDGFGTNTGVIVMAATNRPEILDSALLRSGRFDRQVLVDRPDIAGREEILRIHSREVKLDPSIDLHQIALITSGFVGADLEALVNEAALLAARLNKSSVTMDEFTEGVERVTAGLQKKKRVITEEEKKRVSYHECGHALVACLLPNTDPVHKVSIIPRGLAALGYTLQRPEDERFLVTKNELESRIQTFLAGTIAEKIIFDDISSGARSDLERATELARSMVMNFGMSRLGPINYRENRAAGYLSDSPFSTGREHSERTAWEIDQEVRTIIDSLYDKTFKILQERKQTLIRLANRLLEKEIIDFDELKKIIDSENENA